MLPRLLIFSSLCGCGVSSNVGLTTAVSEREGRRYELDANTGMVVEKNYRILRVDIYNDGYHIMSMDLGK
jgi:hypothetical protein